MKKVFIDLGAHLGESVLRFYKEVGDANTYAIYAFEPNPALIPCLRRNLAGLPNAEIIQKAAAAKDGKVNLFIGSINDADGSTIIPHKVTGNIDYQKPVEVISVNFSKWLFNLVDGTDYVVLKINIEGGEYEVMNSMMTSGALKLVSQIYLILHAHKIGDAAFQVKANEIKTKFLAACQVFEIPTFVTNDGHNRFDTSKGGLV